MNIELLSPQTVPPLTCRYILNEKEKQLILAGLAMLSIYATTIALCIGGRQLAQITWLLSIRAIPKALTIINQFVGQSERKLTKEELIELIPTANTNPVMEPCQYLGKGMHGTVWGVGNVAIKLFKGKKRVTEAVKEFQIGSSLNYPNIIRHYSLVKFKDQLGENSFYLTMERVRGNTLYNNRRTNAEGSKIFAQFFKAISYLFDKGYIPADLHLGNLMVTGEGELKIIDLGDYKKIKEITEEKIIDLADDMFKILNQIKPGSLKANKSLLQEYLKRERQKAVALQNYFHKILKDS